jgi:hypothetical protein
MMIFRFGKFYPAKCGQHRYKDVKEKRKGKVPEKGGEWSR